MKVTIARTKNRMTGEINYAILYRGDKTVYLYQKDWGGMIELMPRAFDISHEIEKVRTDVDIIEALSSYFKQ